MKTRVLLIPGLVLALSGSCLLAAEEDLQASAVQALVTEADTLLLHHDYHAAIDRLREAHALNDQAPDAPISRNILNSLANLSYNTGQLDSATRYFRELVRLDEAGGDQQGLSVSLFNLAHALASRQLFAEADQYFRQSLALSRELGDESGTAFTLKAMGVNAQATGDADTAEPLLQAALDKFAALGDEQQEAAVLRHLGDIHLGLDDADAAVEYYLQAVPVLARNAFNSALLRTYRGLSLAYERLGKLDKALIAQRAYADLLQFDLQQQNEEGTQRMQAQFETQRYADDNARLHAIRIQQELQIEENRQLLRLQFLVLILGLGMLALVVFMLLRSRHTAKRMHALAITDELTGSLNRRAIMNKGQEEWQRAARFHHPFACLMFDVDHFKSINDTYGHAVGDTVLRSIARTLRELLRKTDFVGRIGGEEFLILAPETDRIQALTLAERIRIGIQNSAIEGIDDRQVTVSIGIAGLHKEQSLEALIQHADKALYTAKESGRNRCILYQDKLERQAPAAPTASGLGPGLPLTV